MAEPWRRLWITSGLIATIAGAAAGAAMVYIAFQENLHDETFDSLTGEVDWGYVVWLFLAWFVTAFFVTFAVSVALKTGTIALRRRMSGRDGGAT